MLQFSSAVRPAYSEEMTARALRLTARALRLDKCGHLPPPLIYCSDHGNPGTYRAIPICFVICGILGIEKLSCYVPSEHSFLAIFVRYLLTCYPVKHGPGQSLFLPHACGF